MYIKYDENAKIKNGEYLCVSGSSIDTDYGYGILLYCDSPNDEGITEDDFEGKGFYNIFFDGYVCKVTNIIAYQPVEKYIPQTKEITNE